MGQSVPDRVKAAMRAVLPAPGDLAGGIPGQERILAAVSGGADSVCLLLSLRELGYDVCAVHVEHGIRGEESLGDCAFVRKLCREHGILLRVVRVDAKAVSKERSMSLEEAARTLRREALIQTAHEWKIRVIAMAHHRMDQAETVLWNLIRGSSTGGLGGIRPVRGEDGCDLVRPLLACGRDQIEEYLRKKGVPWRTDRTNADTCLTRNAIRLKVLPVLEELNPGAVRHIADAASDLRKVEDWLAAQTEAAWKDVILSDLQAGMKDRNAGAKAQVKDLTADREALKKYPEVLRTRILRRMIARCCGRERDISRAHILALDRLAMGGNGHEVSLPDGLRAISEEGVLRLTGTRSRKTETVVALERDGRYCFPTGGTGLGPEEEESGKNGTLKSRSGEECGIVAQVSFLTWQGADVPKKKYTKYLAYDTMAPCIVLRTRREGDYLTVNASLGRKKLKDYLIDEKVPRSRRDSMVLVAQGSHVLWVVGMRISEDAKVTRGSRIVRIEVSPDRTADGAE